MRVASLAVIIMLTVQPSIYAFEDRELSITEVYEKLGYTDLLSALDQYEEQIEQQVYLPSKIPFQGEHFFGKVNENGLSIAVVGEDDDRVFHVHLTSESRNELPSDSHTYELSDGTEVFIVDVDEDSKDPDVSWLYMDKYDQTYSIVINSYQQEVRHYKLMGVAESI
ncbi:hypothetical protein [Alkalibacillus silvisoli]|uniref:DUF4367 domain-containing protein n=1 Tax=Alkalibacillus silvisoli TaxID=392823 RepID=A0ABN0ZN26_9BACI